MPLASEDDRDAESKASVDLPKGSQLQQLLSNPTLYEPVRKPHHSLVLAHGLYGWDVISFGPATNPKFQIHYWSNILAVLRKIGAEVIVTGVPSRGSVASRAEKMHEFLDNNHRGKRLNLIAHSMGGLDCRHLISRVKPTAYHPLSLTTLCTPHRGSPFMDWCAANIGIGALREALDNPKAFTLPYTLKSPILSSPSPTNGAAAGQDNVPSFIRLPSSLTTLLLSLVDSPAYGNLTARFCTNVFNPATPDMRHVKYFSVAARTRRTSIFHPLWLPKLILDETEGALRNSHSPQGIHGSEGYDHGNDGLVPVESAKWGEFLGIVENCDHWDIRGAQGFSNAWERVGRSGKGGWSEFFGWQNSRDSGKLAIDPDCGVPKPVNDSLKTHASSILDEPSPVEQEKHFQERTKLKAAFKWIANRVPTENTTSRLSSLQLTTPASFSASELRSPPRVTRTSPLHFNLERFYIALCRKLYDEGL
ncbi:uncharacterized protein EI90DRAFT_2994520 [Cantharellus anzutake]|uniref:uncharacterized protein n=1 Tax=Cantharellus anzutake TaxID=1750568 RepID=UPI001903886D|nr:uncharacterized protein EI90DRAFT_2994520 [Cantharellus anzutake]KAF8333567.1 hypothetical protein EI90DRAFT_2994520 [Cantharellus anzutake]